MLNQYENEANIGAHERTTGPEIWRQTEGKITHFVASLGTCGTITGNGRYLKKQNPEIKIIGVHPEEGHDIPGVRSLKQLNQTKLFLPGEYDEVVEVNGEEAYQMCLRLNREESLIAGPSSALALLGAQKVIQDDPNAVVVIMFGDNVFKYASSIERHFPEFRSTADQSAATEAPAPSPKETFFDNLVAHSRNPNNTLELEELKKRLDAGDKPLLLDVRDAESHTQQHVSGAVNIPVGELAQRQNELPDNLNAPIVTICFRGNMSISGMLLLQSLGYNNVQSLKGGTIGWAELGFPTN